jgi:sec-independent protein translocase protein TatA
MGPELWIVAGVIVLLFGGSQLPKLARSLGEAKKEFEGGQKDPDGVATASTEKKTTESKTTESKTTDATVDDDKA